MTQNSYIIDYVLEKAEGEKLAKRAKVYRNLAPMLPAKQRENLLGHASELEELENAISRSRKQFQLQLKI